MDYARNQDCATNIDQDIDMQLHINASAGSEEKELWVNSMMLTFQYISKILITRLSTKIKLNP
jgi:hypothetical protein